MRNGFLKLSVRDLPFFGTGVGVGVERFARLEEVAGAGVLLRGVEADGAFPLAAERRSVRRLEEPASSPGMGRDGQLDRGVRAREKAHELVEREALETAVAERE